MEWLAVDGLVVSSDEYILSRNCLEDSYSVHRIPRTSVSGIRPVEEEDNGIEGGYHISATLQETAPNVPAGSGGCDNRQI